MDMNVFFEYWTLPTTEADFFCTGQRVTHNLRARNGKGVYLGHMVWTQFHIRDIQVVERYQRRGVATALWREAQRLAAENPDIPEPRHSPARTESGNAWAIAVGGELPVRLS